MSLMREHERVCTRGHRVLKQQERFDGNLTCGQTQQSPHKSPQPRRQPSWKRTLKVASTSLILCYLKPDILGLRPQKPLQAHRRGFLAEISLCATTTVKTPLLPQTACQRMKKKSSFCLSGPALYLKGLSTNSPHPQIPCTAP